MHLIRHFKKPFALFAALAVLTAASVQAADSTSPSPEKEKELIVVLQSDGPGAAKAIACKMLVLHGTDNAVPELAKLLSNEELASWARIALEAIPGSAADEALRKGSTSLQGKLLVGTLNSIGVRRDSNAVELLTTRLQDQDADAASAAAVALGQIGNAPATKALRAALTTAPAKVRSAVAEGCVRCAERILSEGNAAEAAAIYDEVRKADVPKPRILEATRGAILSRKEEGIALLLEQFQSTDKAMFNIALTTAREFPGNKVDEALATEMTRATPERAALIVQGMADRKETVVLPAILKAAAQGPKAVRVAAINALARVGNNACLVPLLEMALDADADVAQAAKVALGDLPGDSVNSEIVALLPSKANGKIYPVLLEVVGQRRIDATSELLKALDSGDAKVRSAGLIALGETIDLKDLPVLISQVVSAKHKDDSAVSQQALKAACVRMPDREACAAELAKAIGKTASLATKTVLLQICGAVGGTKALETIGTAAKSNESQLQDASTRLLGEWMTADAAPVLLDLAQTGPAGDKYQVRAVRGYIRIARQFVLPEAQRVEMCQKAFEISNQTAEKKMVLDVLKRYPNAETLKLAVKAIQVPEIKNDATQATLAIVQKLGGKVADLKDVLSKIELDKVKLEIVKAEFGAGANQKDVTDVLKKQAGDVALITLPSTSYNASFGGDPAPGTVKLLKVQYRINGKPAEASFAEDGLIILPMPK